MTTYLVLDIEHHIDRDAHKRYLQAERMSPDDIALLPARDPAVTPRWPFFRIGCMSWIRLESDPETGALSPATLTTVSAPEMTERQMLQSLFEAVRDLGRDASIVTWGGTARDIPSIVTGACRAGLVLPEALSPPVGPFALRERRDRHLDLMLAWSSSARVHMSEVAAALSVPSKVVGGPGAIQGWIDLGKWSLVRSACESDALTAAMLLGRLLASRGCGHGLATSMALARLGASMTHRPYAPVYEAYRQQLGDMIAGDLAERMREAA